MSDPVLFSVVKALATPAMKLVSYAFDKFRRPLLSTKRAPKNLFEYVKPGTSLAKVREILGSPHGEAGSQLRYVFSEACVQIDSADMIAVDSVSVGLSSVARKNRFHVWPIADMVLGKTKFASILDSEDKIEFDYSSKFYHFYVLKYFGFPGCYWNYALGYLECPRISPDGHHWSPDSQSREEIPKEMSINWACVTRQSEPPPFNYYGFL
jgi:hypothetical protein